MSRGDQPGLRLRLGQEARRISAQHDYLDALVETAARALDRDGPAEARHAIRGLRGALDAHFALEEQVHFPALHGLDAARDRELALLVEEHARFREELAALEKRAGSAERERALADLVALADRLRNHEEREEWLLAAAAGASGPGSPEGK